MYVYYKYMYISEQNLLQNGLEETETLVKDQGADCHSFVCDVTKKSEVDDVAQSVRETAGNVDVLVNNAGTCTVLTDQ